MSVPLFTLFWVSEVLIMILVFAPIYRFYRYGWDTRRQDFTNRLANKNLTFYFDRFWKDTISVMPPQETPEQYFRAVYNIISGRNLYVLPIVVLLFTTFIFSGLVISTAVRAGYEEYIQYYLGWLDAEHQNISVVHLSIDEISASLYPFSITMLSFPVLAAITGAYLYVMGIVISGYRTRTLASSDLWWSSFRVIIAAPLGLTMAEVLNSTLAGFVGFGLGAFPMDAINRILRRLLNSKFNISEQQNDIDDLVRLSGVTSDVSATLQVEGIRSILQVACEDPVPLAIRSGLSFDYVLNLVSQAQAWSYMGETISKLAPLGLGDARSIARLMAQIENKDPNATEILNTAATQIGMNPQLLVFNLKNIANDKYTIFLSNLSG